MVAAKKNQAKGVIALLESGADPKMQDQHGNTAAYYAKHKGHQEVCKALSL